MSCNSRRRCKENKESSKYDRNNRNLKYWFSNKFRIPGRHNNRRNWYRKHKRRR